MVTLRCCRREEDLRKNNQACSSCPLAQHVGAVACARLRRGRGERGQTRARGSLSSPEAASAPRHPQCCTQGITSTPRRLLPRLEQLGWAEGAWLPAGPGTRGCQRLPALTRAALCAQPQAAPGTAALQLRAASSTECLPSLLWGDARGPFRGKGSHFQAAAAGAGVWQEREDFIPMSPKEPQQSQQRRGRGALAGAGHASPAGVMFRWRQGSTRG